MINLFNIDDYIVEGFLNDLNPKIKENHLLYKYMLDLNNLNMKKIDISDNVVLYTKRFKKSNTKGNQEDLLNEQIELQNLNKRIAELNIKICKMKFDECKDKQDEIISKSNSELTKLKDELDKL